jgi:hypothetical protein
MSIHDRCLRLTNFSTFCWTLLCGNLADDARFKTRRRNLDRRLRELPDPNDDAENEDRVEHSLKNGAALLFRADYQSVGGFEFLVHTILGSSVVMHPPCHRTNGNRKLLDAL